MRIYLSNAGAITLREPADLRRLDVLADPQASDRLEHAIARVGRREEEGHIRLSPSVLRFLSGHAGESEWEAGFAAMVDYAARHGWVDERGDIRAHLVIAESDEVAGMIVSSLTSISADPPMVGFFVQQTSSARAALLRNDQGVPILTDALASIECDIICTEVLGTHDLIVGKIRKTACRQAPPVINFNAGTHKISQLGQF